MRHTIVVMVLCMVVMIMTVAGCFLGAVTLIDQQVRTAVATINHQVRTNRQNGDHIRALICELVRHDHLLDRGCE